MEVKDFPEPGFLAKDLRFRKNWHAMKSVMMA